MFDFDYYIFTETWLTPDIINTELGLEGYQVFRFNRNAISSSYSRGGGVLIAIKIKYAARVLSIPFNHVEQLLVAVSVGNLKLVLGGVYIPPKSSIDIYDSHISSVKAFRSKYSNYEIIISVDFNLPMARNDSSNYGLHFLTSSPQSDSILFGYSFFNFYQYNNVLNLFNSMLDLVFSSLITSSCLLSLLFLSITIILLY